MSYNLVLPFVLEPQHGHLMCWASVAIALRRYYSPTVLLSQEVFARELKGDNFDQVCEPLQALSSIGLEYWETVSNLSLSNIQTQLTNGDPVLACMKYFIGWHLVVIYGLSADDQLYIADPLYGISHYTYQGFVTAYRKYYQWTHSYQIQKVNKLPLKFQNNQMGTRLTE